MNKALKEKLYHIFDDKTGDLLAHGGNPVWTFDQAADLAYRFIDAEVCSGVTGEYLDYLERQRSKMVSPENESQVEAALKDFASATMVEIKKNEIKDKRKKDENYF